MKLTLFTDDLQQAPVDLLALGVFSDEPDRGLGFSELNRALDGALEQACRDEEFRGNAGQFLIFNVQDQLPARRILVYGYGQRDLYEAETARRFSGTAARLARQVNASSMALMLSVTEVPAPEGAIHALMQGLAEGAALGSYGFGTYITREKRESRLKEVRIAFATEDVIGVKGATLRAALNKGQCLAEAASVARDLVNEPANVLTPSALADRARSMAKASELGCKILGPRDLERQGMGLMLGVALGSEQEPRLIHLSYEPEGASADTPCLAFVGKGLTFDAGGLSLKKSDDMVPMKSDMGGAAAVFGAMKAIAELRPDCTVHGIIGAAENMPDGRAIRPSDVLRSKKGITVEVMNTDAEGRLVLADALAYAAEQRPTDIIDVATLTGACMVALGRTRAGAFVRDDEMAEDLARAWTTSGERFWRMPLDEDLRDQLKSDIADIKNLGERWGGAVSAALFLGEFVDPDFTRWAHFDIAGPVMSGRETGHTPKGGTGFGVRTLVEYALLRAEQTE